MPPFMRVKEGRTRPSVAAILLSLACLLPVALAASSTGNLTVGSLTLPANASNTLRLVGLVHNDAANLSGGLQSEKVTLCKYEATFAEIANDGEPLLRVPLSVDVEEACFPQTSVVVTLDGLSGWVGFRPRIEGTAEVTTSARATVTPEILSTLASIGDRIAASDNDDRQPRFYEVVSGDHLLYSTAGLVVYQGDGELRIMGPEAHVKAAENVTTYTTGEETRGGTPNAHERVMRWLSIRYDAATVTMETTTPFLLAARSVPSLAWDGNATVANVRGSLHADGQEYAPARPGASAYVDGAFTGSLAPEKGGEAATLALAGDLRGTSLQASARVPVPATKAAFPWLPVIFGAVVVVAGTGAILALRHRRRHPKPVPRAREGEPEAAPPVAVAVVPARRGNGLVALVVGSPADRATAFEERADRLADGRSWLQAADLYGKVRRLDPARPKVAMKEGVALFHAGRLRLALASFHDAALLADDGDAEAWAARCLVRSGDVDAAEAIFLAGLARSPTMETLDTMETHADLAILRVRPKVRAALDSAWERVGNA